MGIAALLVVEETGMSVDDAGTLEDAASVLENVGTVEVPCMVGVGGTVESFGVDTSVKNPELGVGEDNTDGDADRDVGDAEDVTGTAEPSSICAEEAVLVGFWGSWELNIGVSNDTVTDEADWEVALGVEKTVDCIELGLRLLTGVDVGTVGCDELVVGG